MDNVQPGQSLGPYRIVSQIGQGGMATVYKAYHAAMDRYVAVKVLPPQLAQSAEFSGRFQQEARTIAKLEHPHILPVHDFGESQGLSYLVMRYLEAGTLKDRLQSGPLPLAEIDRLFTQLADALAYAHSHSVVHRDLKPSNVMLDARGDLFLTDFGVAKLLEANTQFTATGGMMGTPAYMSPEQAQGIRVDQRSDIYSLGIILYEMVTGRVPYEAETPLAVALQHLNAPLPPPTSLKPGLTPAIERVLLKALAKNPDDRYATARDFLAAWKAALAESGAETLRSAAPASAATTLAGQTIASSAPTVAGAQAARRPFPLALALGGVGLVVVVIIVAAFAFRIGRNRTVARVAGTATARAASTQAGPATAAATPAPTAAAATLPPEPTAVVVPHGPSGWTSWTAVGTWFLTVRGDTLVTSGWGGVTVWNLADGTVRERFTTGDGLPHPLVNAVVFDEETGGTWLATDNGVALFEDDEWTYYTDEDGLDSNNVTTLNWTQQGLLAGTGYSHEGGGLNLLTDQGWRAVPDFPSAQHDEQPDMLSYNVHVVVQEDSGVLWVGTLNGLGRYDGQSWTRYSTADGLPGNDISALMHDGESLWVGTNGGAARFDGTHFERVEQLADAPIYGIIQDAEGHYWFSGGGGIWRYDPGRADWQTYDNTRLPDYTMGPVVSDEAGVLYFGSCCGKVARFGGDDFEVWSVPDTPGLAALGRVLPAPDGRLWFVQEYGGHVDILDPTGETWERANELPGDILGFDSLGKAWLAEWENGVWILQGNDEVHLTTEHGLPSNFVSAMALEPGSERVWLGTEGGLALVDLAAGASPVVEVVTAEEAGLAAGRVRRLFTAGDGTVWWADSEAGLSRLTPGGEWSPVDLAGLFGYPEQVNDLAETPDGALWMATAGAGLWRLQEGEWTGFQAADPGVDLPSDYLYSITVAPDGSLWFGTDSGAARWDGNEWSAYTVDDGLIYYNVNDIYVDADGTAWFATSGGITRFVP